MDIHVLSEAIRKIDKRHKLSVYDDVLKEIDVYKWSKENV